MDNIFDLNRQMQIFAEAYFGKNKNVIEIERCIEKIRNKYADFFKRNIKDIYNDPIFKKMISLIEDEFGFTSVSFIINNAHPELMMNAFTIPMSGLFGALHPVEDAIVGSSGIKYKKEMNYSIIICIDSSLLFNPKLTAGEVCSLVLHEIGHNFTYVANGHLVPFKTMLLAANWYYLIQNISKASLHDVFTTIINTTTHGNKFLQWLSKYRNNSIYNTIYDFVDTISHLALPVVNKLFNATEPLLQLMNIARPANILAMINPVNTAVSTLYYHDEKFADRFAAMYGYGEELSSALFKIQEINVDRENGTTHYISAVPIIGHAYALALLTLRFAIFPFIDPHPQDVARAMSMVKMFEHDLDDPSISPKLKKQIHADLDKVKKLIKDKSEYKDNESAGIGIVRMYNNFLLKIFPDGDIRNVLDNYIFKSNDRINNTFNSIKDELK